MHSAFSSNRYLLKKQVFALTGTFRLCDDMGQMVLFSRQKMFKLREDIRIFSDESMGQEVLRIQARHIIDFAAAYDVFDSLSGERLGTLRRKGLKSVVRDEWQVLHPDERQIGVLQEDTMEYALLRRLLLGIFLPQNYDLLIGNERAADLRQRFNLFRYELEIDFGVAGSHLIDKRVGIAAAILLAAIEGRQDD